MPINRGMDKEDVLWYIYSGILLSHKKEQNGVICRDMDGLRDYYAEWSKSERGKEILNINIYVESRKMVWVILFAKQIHRNKWTNVWT